MIQNILWIVLILVAAWSQYIIIEKSKRVPNHLLWFVIRAAAFGLFLWWYIAAGYYIVWAIPFMIASFGFLFPTLLNLFRGKEPEYLSDRGYDKVIKKIFGHQQKAWFFWLMAFVITLPLQVYYNFIDMTSFMELWR